MLKSLFLLSSRCESYIHLYILYLASDVLQGPVIASLNKRKGTILGSEEQDGATCVRSEVPLSQMFGYSTDLRSLTQVCVCVIELMHN